MKLRWFTTAAFTLREGDTTVAFDPFLGLPLGRRWPDLSRASFQDAAAVFVTHGHVDHILELPALLSGSKAPSTPPRLPAGPCNGTGSRRTGYGRSRPARP